MLVVFAALLALIAAQCNVEKSTFSNGDASVTFGAGVGDWMPVFYTSGAITDVVFSTWTQATFSRWMMTDIGSTAQNNEYCDLKGQYSIDFSADCSEITFSTISDHCHDRLAFFHGVTFTMVSSLTGLETCISPSAVLETRLQTSENSPRLSDEPSTIVFGMNEFAIVSVGSQAALFQRWKLEDQVVSIIDVASSPSGLACHSADIASYSVAFDDNCEARFCGGSDSCRSRAELFHQAPLNGYGGDMCPEDFTVEEEPVRTECSPNQREWLKHPYDCVDQQVEGGCMYCKGIAKGEFVSLCLNREGAGCNQIFDSPARMTFCNMEFECPASTFSSSLFVFICALVAMIFYQ